MFIKSKVLLISLVCLILPAITLGAYFTTIGTVTLNGLASLILSALWKFFVAFAMISFVIAGIYFLTAQGQPDKIDTAKRFVLWGVIGIIVAILAFSIVNIVISLF